MEFSTMSCCTMFLACLVFPGAGPLGADPLQTVTAALEETLSRRPTVEVVFHTTHEWAPGYKDRRNQLLADSTTTWLSKAGKQTYAYSTTNPKMLLMKFSYDGQVTHEWTFDPKSGRPRDVWIWPTPPRSELLMQNTLAVILGHVTHGHVDGLVHFYKAAQRRNSLSTSEIGPYLEIALGSDKGNGDQLFVTLDPNHSYRQVSWRLEQWNVEHTVSQKTEFVVDEFQSVQDDGTGEQTWFPLRAQIKTPISIARVDVVSVRMNHEIPDSRFSPQSPPFGVILHEMPKVAGGNPRRSIVGGEAAHQERMQEINDEARREIALLEEFGVTYDATPPGTGFDRYWWLATWMLLASAMLCWMFRRKR